MVIIAFFDIELFVPSGFFFFFIEQYTDYALYYISYPQM